MNDNWKRTDAAVGGDENTELLRMGPALELPTKHVGACYMQ